MKYKMVVLLVHLSLLVIGCSSGETDEPITKIYADESRNVVSCKQIQENTLSSLKFGEQHFEDVYQWVQDKFSLEEQDITIHEYDDNIRGIDWEQNEIVYWAYFQNDVLTKIYKNWRFGQQIGLEPIGDEIIDCLGIPDFYEASYGPAPHHMTFYLTLWYLERGVIVEASLYTKNFTDPTPVVNGNIIMTQMIVVAPGNEQQMIKNVLLFSSYKAQMERLNHLKPWPGSWSKIEVADFHP